MNRAALIRRVRAAFDMTQTDLATKLGYGLRPWQRKESGSTPVRDSEMLAIAAHVSGIRDIDAAVRIIETACGDAEARKAKK